MSLRPPQSFTGGFRFETGDGALQVELAAEQAASLGRAGRRVEATLAALREAAEGDRPAALKAAADAVWGLFIQRELLGQRNQKPVIEHYGIPAEVLVRLGAR
ncbi:DUF6665 family protein [Caulobacter mirabilis]|uniref:Uncharacterized protein n=1 Tax=Caulobacter mirabilis TaxID=69666 RepID=A0A2D2B3D9_9CAUL|nr:DUF6665 family protein [Caulobacter mirabilis]ATQ44747.1 hypothetical protein CSW64_21325 [Caulobacter mirabilis]